MSLRIIAGTHTFVDLTGKFRRAWQRANQRRIIYDIDGVQFKKRRFDRVTITKDGSIVFQPSRIFPLDRQFYRWTVSQPTGSCKTILLIYHLRKTYLNGGNIAGNLSYKYFDINRDKKPDEWQPNIQTMDDFLTAKKCHIGIDDIKGTADSWQAEESVLIGHAANLARKGGVDIDITSQGVTNFIAPNIRRVTSGLEIPYCTIRDKRKESPDGKGFPVEIEVLSLLPSDPVVGGDIFVGFGLLNDDIPDNKILNPTQEFLSSYKTMEVATGLKTGKGRTSRPGLEGEKDLLAYLQFHYPDMEFVLKNGKGVFDIVAPNVLLDHVGIEEHGTGFRLLTTHKNLSKHKDYAKLHQTPAYIVFKWHGDFRFLNIHSKYLLPPRPMVNEKLMNGCRSRIAVFG